jgi:predicted nucleic acid-binding protein
VPDEEFLRARQLIRHVNDVPFLAAAIMAKPDWLLTDNAAHFEARVSQRTGLQIATPAEFLASCGRLF